MKINNLIDKDMKKTDLIEENYQGQLPEIMDISLNLDIQEDPPELTVDTHNYKVCGTPADVWNGLVITWSLPPNIDASQLYDFVEDELKEELKSFKAEVIWDGNNYIGKFDDYHHQTIQYFIDKNCPTIENGGWYTPDEYLDYIIKYRQDHVIVDGFKITAKTNDKAIEIIAEKIEETLEDGFVIIGDLKEYLDDLKQTIEE